MGASILQSGCIIRCPHQAIVTVVNTNRLVKVAGSYVLLADDVYTIAGCTFMVGNTPHPCVTVEWQLPAQRITVDGRPVLMESSIGLCKTADQVVQGNVLVSGVQKRVKAT